MNIAPIVFDFNKTDPGLTNINRQKEWMGKANLVIMTGTVLVNQTFTQLINWINPHAKLIIAGPSTLLHPIMFDCFEDTTLSGMVFRPNQPELVACIAKGMGTRYFKKFGKKVDVYPF